ncbi:hypothetical protein ACQ4LK_24275, partial [Bacillus pumilus]
HVEGLVGSENVYKRQGDTTSGGSKPAKTETGLIVNVPFFVNQGDKLVINTSDGSYVSRA